MSGREAGSREVNTFLFLNHPLHHHLPDAASGEHYARRAAKRPPATFNMAFFWGLPVYFSTVRRSMPCKKLIRGNSQAIPKRIVRARAAKEKGCVALFLLVA